MPQETLTLAPAAGAGIGKILADALLANPEFVPAMLASAMNGLKATRGYWSGKGENAEYIVEPDFKTQLQAFALLLAHMEGEPIKRVIHQHIGDGKAVDPLAALQGSQALRDAAKKLIAKAEWHESGRSAKPADPVLDVG